MGFGPHLLLATLEGLVTSAVLALTALGLSLVFGVMRIVNVAQGEFFMLGAVVAWFVSSTFAGNFILLGSIANLIVVEQAAAEGVIVSFKEHAKTGIPVTLGSLAVLAGWLACFG